MQSGDLVTQRHAEPAADRRILCARGVVDIVKLLFGHARAFVNDLDRAGRRFHQNGTAGRRRLHGIADQVSEQAQHQRAIRSQFVRLFIEIDKKAESAEISERALDLRGLLDAIALTEKGIKAGDALEMCVVNKTFDKYERAMIRDVISARIPADLGRNEIFG